MKNIRYYLFWFFDFLRCSSIRKHYNEIKAIYFGGDIAEKLKKQRLEEILSYASEKTVFYKDIGSSNIKKYPIMSKQDIIANMDNLFSFDYVNSKETLKTMSTSGSTGTPFKIYQNAEKVKRNRADLLFFYAIGKYNIGDRFYYIRIWNDINKKSKKDQFIENFKMYDTTNLDSSGVQRFINTMLNDKKSKVLLGYASSFTAIMNNISIKENANWNIKSIFTGAEELPLTTKRKMENLFRCPIISRYSNQENGVLAQQPITGEDFFILNEGSYFFEFLQIDSDNEAQEGEPARIVVTDLFNKAVPMIRYDTGDIGVFQYMNGKKILLSIEGRKVDYLRKNSGEILSPHFVTNLMWKYEQIKQFQFIQESLFELTIKLVYTEGNEQLFDRDKNELEMTVRELFGKDTQINMELLKIIPLEPSGKRKYIISKI